MKTESLLQRARGGLLSPIVRAMNSIEEIIQSSDQDRDKLLDALISLFVLVLKADGHVSEAELQAVSRALRDEHGEAAVKKLQEKVDADTLPNTKDACAALVDMPPDDREMLLHSLFIAGYSDNQYGLPEQKALREIATELEIDDATYDRLQQESLVEHNRRMRLVRSGTGLLAAGAILAMFIITATFLKAVLFGLILAYFFLPVAQRLSRSFINNGLAAKCYSGLGLLFAPFRLIIRGVQSLFRRKDGEEKNPEPDPEAEIRTAIGRACNATVLGVMLSVMIIIVSFTLVTLSYKPAELNLTAVSLGTFSHAGNATDILTLTAHGVSTGDLVTFNTSAPAGATTTATYYAREASANTITLHTSAADAASNSNIVDLTDNNGSAATFDMSQADALREKAAGFVEGFSTWKVIGQPATEFAALLRDDAALEKFGKSLVGGSPGDEASPFGSYVALLGTAAGILGAIGNFLLNALLALFFFSFFLKKMALFHHEHQEQKQEGDYLVQSLFQTSWLPTTSEETLRSAAEVINEVFYKLKTWVRGYLWIIIIETIAYITIFLLLGVPYAIILGGIAGLTVLLPFIGPLISIILTMGVCLITGQANMSLLLAIGGVYAIMNMIVEQLFLYPAFVGEALGLNILETMIVVLLGGLFAGLAGVIFAVPAASVLKFIVPRLYQSIFQKEELVLPETATAK